MPIDFLDSLRATSVVVPVPQKGSRTMPSGGPRKPLSGLRYMPGNPLPARYRHSDTAAYSSMAGWSCSNQLTRLATVAEERGHHPVRTAEIVPALSHSC